MRFRVLGPLEVVEGGGEARVPAGAKERAVLARLLLEPGQVVATEALLQAAWPDGGGAGAARSLAVRLANLRAFLEPSRAAGTPSTLVLRVNGGYRLAVSPDCVDAQRLAALVRRADSELPESALAAYEEALALWRGLPLPDLGDADCALAERERLRELRVVAAAGRLHALVELGRHEAALPDLRRLVAEEPWREHPVRSLAVALYRSGRQVEALDAIRAVAAELREQGLDPSPETRALEQQILRHELAPPAAVSEAPVGTAGAAPNAPPPFVGPGRVPTRTSRFVGREDELARATALVASGRLLTVTGVGGAGKTRLAIELAGRLDFTSLWCELAPLDTGDNVACAVADALGLPPAGERLERIAAHLAPRRFLLVLDNCEHVLDGAAAVVERLLAECPELRIVCTSRAPLGVEGERVLRLDGLDEAAVTLFLDRAQAAGGLGGVEGVEELCRRLDGLPLAIELAAGRTRSMTAAEIAAALDERFALLSVPGRRAVARHATLRAAIDWSYELLGDAQRRAFDRLAVFHRSFTPSAARDVCAGDGVDAADVPDLLDQLVAHSMLTAESARGRTRYRLLESLREYAAGRLEQRGETEDARDRHASHYVRRVERALAAGARGPGLPHAREFDDVRAAVRWRLRSADEAGTCVLIGGLWPMSIARHADEIAALAEEALGRDRPGGDRSRTEAASGRGRARVHALGTAATARMSLGDVAAARAHALAALELESAAGAPALVARRVLSGIAYQAGEGAEALRRTSDLAARARAAGDEPLACEADGFSAQLLRAAGDTARAAALAATLRERADRLGAPFVASWSRYVSGVVALDGNDEAASCWLTEALEHARASSQHHMIRFSLRALGVAALLLERHGAAREHLSDALAHHEPTCTPATQCATLTAIAALIAARGRHEPAGALLAASEAVPAAPLLASLSVLDTLANRTRREITAARAAEGIGAGGRAMTLAAAEALARAELQRP